MVLTLLKDSGPVDLDDRLLGIFIFLAVIHGDDALSSELRFWIPSPRTSSKSLVTGLLGLGTGLAAHLIPSAYVSSTSSNSYCLGHFQNERQWLSQDE